MLDQDKWLTHVRNIVPLPKTICTKNVYQMRVNFTWIDQSEHFVSLHFLLDKVYPNGVNFFTACNSLNRTLRNSFLVDFSCRSIKNIIPKEVTDNCWTESSNTRSEGTKLQVKQRFTSSGMIMVPRNRRQCKRRWFFHCCLRCNSSSPLLHLYYMYFVWFLFSCM